MATQQTRKASWWQRNQSLHEPIEAMALALTCLLVISVTALAVGDDSAKYSKVQTAVFLNCVGVAMIALFLKPPSMWRSLLGGMRDVAAGRELHVDGAVAIIVAVLVASIVVVSTLIMDWTTLTLGHGIGGVVAVNLALVGRGLWAKYGPQPHGRTKKRRSG